MGSSISNPDEYPHSYILRAHIDQKSLEISGNAIIIVKDSNYTNNKAIASTIYLKYDDLSSIIDLISVDTIEICVSIITKHDTIGPYCHNVSEYLTILKLLMNKLEKIYGIHEELQLKLNIFCENLEVANIYKLRERCDDNQPIKDNYKMIEIMQSYHIYKPTDIVCKYCLIAIPTNMLVHPCKCKDIVHIHCFQKWYNSDISQASSNPSSNKFNSVKNNRTKCEICLDPFSGINEKRIRSCLLSGDFIETDLFFPFDDYYPTPLMNTYGVSKVTGRDRYVLPLIYLQCNRMQNLLEDAKINNITIDFGEWLEKFQNRCLSSNYMYRNNIGAYELMKRLLVQYNYL